MPPAQKMEPIHTPAGFAEIPMRKQSRQPGMQKENGRSRKKPDCFQPESKN